MIVTWKPAARGKPHDQFNVKERRCVLFPTALILIGLALLTSDQVTCPSLNQPPEPRKHHSLFGQSYATSLLQELGAEEAEERVAVVVVVMAVVVVVVVTIRRKSKRLLLEDSEVGAGYKLLIYTQNLSTLICCTRIRESQKLRTQGNKHSDPDQ